MRNVMALASALVCAGGCSTLDKSLRLGSTVGSVAGAAATYSAESAAGRSPALESVALGASIGMAVGLITSYFVHDGVTQDRNDAIHDTEVYFGDLPPSPFVIPKPPKKGKR